ncbi:single-pass membrane and coiled-coil domain-containing protein 4 homolog [Amyelois transitella]|uniref:single-pass membrane and coiled-coil domain-containing protein 4 homolog n=1 Tax=Amyelois transitella TaxID=680683 RepID=UPI00067E5BCE|nr:single-pass membrane and coiled-coil domain-containing protein 4 homolog [Amyelois transitella]XP_013198131.1 single-pass membrane and coiled-coil domain-containing protein 4 homolog [Amyelois transitella]XP_053600910.1 single-pass membrane and coiled-coil domain-containing protein 4 homolog [Plodia interpunctella]
MRKLKGAVKETAKQKRERKQEFAKMRQQIHTIVLPTFGVIFLLICTYVYFKTRPTSMQYA